METISETIKGKIEFDGINYYVSRNDVALGARISLVKAQELLDWVYDMIPDIAREIDRERCRREINDPNTVMPTSQGDREIWLEAQDLAAQLEEKYVGPDKHYSKDWLLVVKVLLFLLRTK